MDLFPSTPNLDVLLGRPVCVKLMQAAGGLQGLVMLNGMKLRLLGLDVKKAEAAAAAGSVGLLGKKEEGSGKGGGPSPPIEAAADLTKEAEKVLGGFMIDAVLLKQLFDNDVAQAVSSEQLVVRKALDVLGNKAALAAKADLSGSKRDGSYGNDLADEIRVAVEAAREKGKVDAGHVKALAAVETREDGRKKAGRQVRTAERRERHEDEESMDAVSFILAKHTSVTTMADIGLSLKERETKLLLRDDIKAEIAAEEARRQQRKARKLEQQHQQSDLYRSGGCGADLYFARSSGFMQHAFGVCTLKYERETEAYAKIASLLL